MAQPEDYSTWNVENSVAVHIALRLITAGWLIYWRARDAVEVPGGQLYNHWSLNRLTYLANPTFLTYLNASRGIITLYGAAPANPTFISRLTNDGLLGLQDKIELPALGVEATPERQLRLWELGSRLMQRSRQVVLEAYARNRDEQVLLSDALQQVFEQTRYVSLVNHTGAGEAIDEVEIVSTRLDTDIVYDQTETEAFLVEGLIRLDYIV